MMDGPSSTTDVSAVNEQGYLSGARQRWCGGEDPSVNLVHIPVGSRRHWATLPRVNATSEVAASAVQTDV